MRSQASSRLFPGRWMRVTEPAKYHVRRCHQQKRRTPEPGHQSAQVHRAEHVPESVDHHQHAHDRGQDSDEPAAAADQGSEGKTDYDGGDQSAEPGFE